MLPKGNVLCCKFSIFNNYILFFVFFFFTNLALKALLSAKLSIFSLRIRVKSPFSHPVFGRSGCRLSNSTAIFLPDVSDVCRWPNPVKFPNVPFFITKSAVKPKNEQS